MLVKYYTRLLIKMGSARFGSSPLWSPPLGTPCRESGRPAACRWCRGRSGRRIPACWRAAAWSCENRLWPSGSPGHSPPQDVCPWSRTWKDRRTHRGVREVFQSFWVVISWSWVWLSGLHIFAHFRKVYETLPFPLWTKPKRYQNESQVTEDSENI